ncbi:DEAD/DEAH box helicase [Candidatus Dojkabacteria bacterium]|nr:DEAD/DEAH box helicase [Candidatus Dojkabacteria bacterium]
MTIENKISQSAEFKKLIKFVNTPVSKTTRRLCTLSGTTIDTQRMLLRLLEKITRHAFIYSTLSSSNTLKYLESLNIYKKLTFKKLKKLLDANTFVRVNKVTKQAEYTLKGDTITFWPSIYLHPLRLSFWGNELESKEMIDEIYLNKLDSLDEFCLGNENLLEDDAEMQAVNITSASNKINPTFIVFGHRKEKGKLLNFNFVYPSLFFKRLDLLQDEIVKRTQKGWLIQIKTIHKDQLPANLAKFSEKKEFNNLHINSGFENPKLKIAFYTDREIFGTIFVASERAKSQKKINRYLAELEGEIEVDNYIVHEDYGIAIYKGIEQKKILEKLSDYLILEYAESDKLSVPLSQVHKLTKYIGPDNVPPKITRLGKTTWRNIKNKVKTSVILIARQLLEHYAKSEIAQGDRLIKHEWEDKFASEFEFSETEDQKRVIDEILVDLSSKKPMNRLLVGDVGFGKTEVAIRAAFRTVLNDKQVAVLCPTTILVSQHYSVFKHRMRNYPIEIATLSRFGSRKENQRIIERLNKGQVDIVIGTHRLLSNDVKFKDLNLLVVDEEQRFGVKQKEKIKKLAYKCNVLSMSATPIPRTLSMALSNLKDISLITTPPPGRKAIKTKVEPFNWNKVAQAIVQETKRDGQVYFLHNEVRTIESMRAKLKKILPNISFRVAHGQMHPSTLDKVMREFYKHKFDCLICTTIIENGIDIKNVNTIIINKAERFGLAQMYQLRGRVGRNTRQASCHLFYTQKNLLKEIEDLDLKEKGKSVKISFEKKAKARLEAILEAQELGSGFKIASRDLEIRGAGNLLGREQHGNISAIGLGLYTQMLSDEVERMKEQVQRGMI